VPQGASCCPCVLVPGAGLCRRLALATGWGSAGPDAASPLLLQLPGAEGAVGGHTAGVSGGDAAGAVGRGKRAPQLGRGARAAACSRWAQLPDKKEEVAWG